MQYLVGTDEAGYGPNLGPLLVSATVWEVPDGVDGEQLYTRLADVIVASPAEVARQPSRLVAMADSKVLYKPKQGLRHLERGLWAAMAVLDRRPNAWLDVWQSLAPNAIGPMQTVPWYMGYEMAVPLDADPGTLDTLALALQEALAAAGVRLLDIHSRAVFPGQFNALIDTHDNKGSALSHTTLDLVAQVTRPLGPGRVSVLCDKHGGRNRYGPLLQSHFPDSLIEIHGESRQRSIYRFGPPERRFDVRFQMKGETYLPAALASMASKYLRELAMRALNAFWCREVPDLKPTAGYPQDAKRFKAEIAEKQAKLGIEDRILWRVR
ncbi:MAG TPA: hypothetical protein VE890_09335 [Thermoguttaceae bacterium]|nr:hypothetical protein [Thermoguttaceae bacterium]